jgi:photosystem II stability/assembly factor-like uncharacterized protein
MEINIKTILFILCVNLAIHLNAQDISKEIAESSPEIWTELHPKVPRTNYWGVYFVNNDIGIATGEKGAIIKTTNGGSSWYNIETSYNKTIRTIGSYNGEKIVAAGDSGLIIISTDYGEVWSTIQSGTNKNFWNIQFITEQIGWLVGEGSSAFKTTDGGSTWINQSTPLNGYPYWDVSFLDTSFGYICTNLGGILRTTDGGLSWDVKQAGDNYGLFSIYVITRMKAVSMGFAGKHAYTSDGGETWQFIGYWGDTIMEIAFLDTMNGFAVGTSSYETTNGGLSWNWRMDMGQSILDITFVDENIGYCAGGGFPAGDALILKKTTNSGQTWNKTIINDYFTDVFFTDENNGWYIGNQTLYQTIDGGINLTHRSDFPGNRPSSVYFLDSLTGIIGAQNKIFKTYDGGISWQEKNITGISGNAGEFIRLFFINNEIGWAISYGYVIKTTDAGENWFSQLNIGGLRGIHFSDSLNGWVTPGGKPYKTTDGGETWVEQINYPSNSPDDVFFNDSLNGFIARTNQFYQTTDGGINWSLVPEVTNFTYGRFSNLSNNLFLAGGPRTYQSTDNGENWLEVGELRDELIEYIRLYSINKGFAVGRTGLILKYFDENIPVELISFSASIQNENEVMLEWSTATEINNRGFEIERKEAPSKSLPKGETSGDWRKVGFVEGNGTTIETKQYSFVDRRLSAGKYYYRLKQIDFDGTYEYSSIISVEIKPPTQFKLRQNYPNPFNPETKIEFQLPEISSARLTVYNILGEKITELVNEKLNAGYYEYTFNGEQFPSGTYIYTLNSEKYNEARKMILLK